MSEIELFEKPFAEDHLGNGKPNNKPKRYPTISLSQASLIRFLVPVPAFFIALAIFGFAESLIAIQELSNYSGFGANMIEFLYPAIGILLVIDFGLFSYLIIHRLFFSFELIPQSIIWTHFLTNLFVLLLSFWLISMLWMPFLLIGIFVLLAFNTSINILLDVARLIFPMEIA